MITNFLKVDGQCVHVQPFRLSWFFEFSNQIRPWLAINFVIR
jgi:hypothetical protein